HAWWCRHARACDASVAVMGRAPVALGLVAALLLANAVVSAVQHRRYVRLLEESLASGGGGGGGGGGSGEPAVPIDLIVQTVVGALAAIAATALHYGSALARLDDGAPPATAAARGGRPSHDALDHRPDFAHYWHRGA